MSRTVQAALLCGMLASGLAAQASEYAQVVSATPVLASVAVPQQVCNDEQRWVQPHPSGAGALLGAIAGGVIGNSVGAGMGRAAATGIGVMAGSIIGDRVEANGSPAVDVPVRRCQTVSSYQQRSVGYDVVYDYAGKRYHTRLASDPGPLLAVNVQPQQLAAAPATPYDAAQPPYPPSYQPVPLVGPVTYLNPTVMYGYGYHGHRYWR